MVFECAVPNFPEFPNFPNFPNFPLVLLGATRASVEEIMATPSISPMLWRNMFMTQAAGGGEYFVAVERFVLAGKPFAPCRVGSWWVW
jgi:hypothetical protein